MVQGQKAHRRTSRRYARRLAAVASLRERDSSAPRPGFEPGDPQHEAEGWTQCPRGRWIEERDVCAPHFPPFELQSRPRCSAVVRLFLTPSPFTLSPSSSLKLLSLPSSSVHFGCRRIVPRSSLRSLAVVCVPPLIVVPSLLSGAQFSMALPYLDDMTQLRPSLLFLFALQRSSSGRKSVTQLTTRGAIWSPFWKPLWRVIQ